VNVRLAPLAALRSALPFGVLLVAAALSAAPAAAQPADSLGLRYGAVEERQTNAQGYYFFVLPGEPTKQVSVWGTVRLPGVYVVSADADLSEVLSLAGGPLLSAIPDRTQRDVTIRVYHTEGAARSLAYEAPLAQMVREPGAHPALRSGDVIEVETRDTRLRDYRDTLAIVASIGTVAVVVLQIVSLATR
jgi:hypothetical protein